LALEGIFLAYNLGANVMMKILSEMADSYGLHELHKKFNENNQFYYDKNEVEKFNGDYSKFYAKPSFPKICFEEEDVNGN